MVIITPQQKKGRRIFRKEINSLLRFSFILLMASLLINSNLFAQSKTYEGVVTSSAEGTPIPGANVYIQGTTTGTITNIDGEFSITAEVGNTLIFTFIGYLKEEVVLGNSTNLTVSLVEDISKLDEVVVIGYGVQKKKLVTGATAQVDGDDLEKRNSTSPLQALQGQAAGVNISSKSGQPGEGMRVIVRGVGTISGAGPLYIVDGLITDNIDYLNPSDIESMDILKDAASCAIYGSRGANGVILVTTKQGKAGKSQVTFDAYYGFQNAPKKIELLGAKDYATIMNEQHLNSGGSIAGMPFDANNLPAYTLNGSADTDWLDEMFVDNAITQNYVIGATGGNEQTTYSYSLSYTGQEGIVGGASYSNMDRYTARVNAENKMYDGRVKVGEHFTFSHTNRVGVGVGDQFDNSLRNAFNVSPLLPMYNDNGEYFNSADETIVDQYGETYFNNAESNPYAKMHYGNQNTKSHQKLIGDIYTEVEIIKNLKFRSSLGMEVYTEQEREYTPIYELSIYSFSTYNKASQKQSIKKRLKNDNVLTYSKDFGEHRIKGMLGQSVEINSGEWMYTENADVAFNDLEHAYIDNTNNKLDAKFSMEGAPEDQSRVSSFFGRLQYDLSETYMLNATFRADGSSKFAPGNQWGYFPSVSAGWVISNESFVSALPVTLDFLKLRASWGQNGSNNADSHQYLAPIKFTQAQYAFGDTEGASTPGSYPERLSYKDLKWEISEQWNIGFDARLIQSHLSVNFDWYNKITKDWLIVAPVIGTAGANPPVINGGSVQNTGVELALSYNNKMGDLGYSVSINGAYNKNEVGEIPTDDGIIHGATNSLYNNSDEFYRAENGHPIGYFWGWETNGLFQYSSDVENYVNGDGTVIQPNAKPGDVKYVDQNDDGKIDADDKVELGDPNPDFTYGINISLTYKAFDFGFNGTGVLGNQIVQSFRGHSGQYSNYTTEIMDRWTGPGTSNEIPRVTNTNINYQFSDLFVKDGGYFRISNITIGVDINKLTNISFLSQCRVYAQVQNLYTFTKYTGMDPDVGYGIYDNDDASDRFSSGIDLGFYPNPRTIMFGVNVKF